MRFVAPAVLLASLAFALPAAAVVPGSDAPFFTLSSAAARSQDSAAAAQGNFGFPSRARETGQLVPGSDHFRGAIGERRVNDVIRSAPAASATPSNRAADGRLVPGSDAY